MKVRECGMGNEGGMESGGGKDGGGGVYHGRIM